MNFGLLGKSLSHSFSKSYFEDKFKKENLTGFTYSNFDVENLDSLHQIIKDNTIKGLNVTILTRKK